MVFKNFIEPGRVAWVSYGEDYGKMCVIVDIRDQNCVLVDGPNFPRVLYPVKRLTLTKLRIPIFRGARTGTVIKACNTAKLEAQWQGTATFKKLAKASTRANLTDFERFQVMIARKR